jgi:hypothetical protein
MFRRQNDGGGLAEDEEEAVIDIASGASHADKPWSFGIEKTT